MQEAGNCGALMPCRMKEMLSILPLNDIPRERRPSAACDAAGTSVEPLTGYWASRDNGNRELAHWLAEASAGADSAGFFPVTYGQLAEAASRPYNETPEYLGENLWVLRQHLEDAGYLSAPDMELERRRLKDSDPVMVYASDDFSRIIRSRGYKKGLLFVKFVTLALSPLDETEFQECDRLIGQWVGKERYRRHLQALLRWYDRRRRLLDMRTKRSFLEIMDAPDRQKLSSQLLSLAARRGPGLSPRAVQQLDRILVMNGYSPGEVHALLHRESLGENRSTPLIQAAGKDDKGGSVRLDPTLVRNIEASTRRVHELLLPIMTAESPSPTLPATPRSAPERRVDASSVLAHLLTQRDEWNVEDLQRELAKAIPANGKNLTVLLESLNDEAYDLADEAAAELEGDTVYVNQDVLSQIQKTA